MSATKDDCIPQIAPARPLPRLVEGEDCAVRPREQLTAHGPAERGRHCDNQDWQKPPRQCTEQDELSPSEGRKWVLTKKLEHGRRGPWIRSGACI